jgi:hypothetical protein
VAAQKKEADAGQAEVQKAVDDGQQKGYIGVQSDAFPNEAHSLKTGPDAPSVLEQNAAAAEAQFEAVKASNGGDR